MCLGRAVPALLPLVVPAGIKMHMYRACVMASAAANVGREAAKMPGLPKPLTSLEAWRVWFGTLGGWERENGHSLAPDRGGSRLLPAGAGKD